MRIRLYRLHRFADPRWVRGVAWSILGGSGPLDSGSNPDGPILMESGRTHSDGKLGGGSHPVPPSRGRKTIFSSEIAPDPWVQKSRWARGCRAPPEGNRTVGDPTIS